MNSLDGCSYLPATQLIIELFIRIDDVYEKNGKKMSLNEIKELNKYLHTWKVKAAKQEAKKQQIDKDNAKRLK